MDTGAVLQNTRLWISSFVIGLNLCPFAQRVFNANQIRYVVSDAKNEEALLQVLSSELDYLVASPPSSTDTTLVIHPYSLVNFLDYVDFLIIANRRICQKRLQGVIQLASFHPDYQFAGTSSNAVENYTNRSPYPMLHLLREKSISKVASDPHVILKIPRRNKDLLKEIGKEKILEMLAAIEAEKPHQ
jgi:hypothetical protein